MNTELTLYRELLADIKVRVRQAQHKASISANTEMILMYWDIGHMIAARQEQEGWGAGVIPRLAAGLKNELPEEKGFSARNIGYMISICSGLWQAANFATGCCKIIVPCVGGASALNPYWLKHN